MHTVCVTLGLLSSTSLVLAGTGRQWCSPNAATASATASYSVSACTDTAWRIAVKIIDRQEKEDTYDYAAVYNNVAVGKSFKVHGATFTLQLPDGRLAIVSCESKFTERLF